MDVKDACGFTDSFYLVVHGVPLLLNLNAAQQLGFTLFFFAHFLLVSFPNRRLFIIFRTVRSGCWRRQSKTVSDCESGKRGQQVRRISGVRSIGVLHVFERPPLSVSKMVFAAAFDVRFGFSENYFFRRSPRRFAARNFGPQAVRSLIPLSLTAFRFPVKTAVVVLIQLHLLTTRRSHGV